MKRLLGPLGMVAGVLIALPAFGGDLRLAGDVIRLSDNVNRPNNRSAVIVLEDPGRAAVPDPRIGGAVLRISGGASPGQCFAEVKLDAALFRAIGGNGAKNGYVYRDPSGLAKGVRRLLIRPGRILLRARGAQWPCMLTASAQRLPVSIEVLVGSDRFCGAFGGEVRRNEELHFVARNSPAPGACPKSDLTVANLNMLHGLFCPAGTNRCRVSDRTDLLFQWVAASGCPDVITLQEVFDPNVPIVLSHLATTCPFTYESVYVRTNSVDDAIILTRYPASVVEVTRLYKGFRYALFARIDHPLGPVDVFTTHLASGSDGAQNPCAGDCPAECVMAGATKVRECQGVQMANLVASRHDVTPPAVATGDFNDPSGSLVYNQFVGHGWTDTYLEAGNPECNSMTGVGCTSGRIDDDLTDMESPASNVNERIDYIFLVPPTVGTCSLDPATDNDGDGTATRIFDDDPNPFAAMCGALPDPICWPSDHEGTELDLNCGS